MDPVFVPSGAPVLAHKPPPGVVARRALGIHTKANYPPSYQQGELRYPIIHTPNGPMAQMPVPVLKTTIPVAHTKFNLNRRQSKGRRRQTRRRRRQF
jgi:hypothetical protein